MLEHRFRVTKYDPRLRNADGTFTGDDWTSMTQIGQVFGGQVLTRERYEQVEAAYLKAVELFAQDSVVLQLDIRTPEFDREPGPGHGPLLPGYGWAASSLSMDVFLDGYEIPLATALELVRAMLREERAWSRTSTAWTAARSVSPR